jgi:UDPglucose 6-dehydrogenase
MNDQLEPIGVIGVGWVGLVTAACFAELGHEVWARDIVPEKIESLARGEVPIHEPGLSELVAKNAERLHFTTEMEPLLDHARLLFVCVDTPPTYSGDADLSRVEAVLEELGDSDEHALVMKSTVPVGTGRSIQRRRPGTGYVSNPEFLKEGTAVQDFMHPDRLVIGADPGSESFGDRVEALYAPLGADMLRADVASAEMIKLASNAFLATKISFINEIANVSEELGADVEVVARGMGLDDRIGPKFLKAGIGWGGSCLVGDETVLVRDRGRTTLVRLDRLWRRLEGEYGTYGDGVIEPDGLEVLSWDADRSETRFLPVMAATRRGFAGELVELRTKMGRRVRCTPDHPWFVSDGAGAAPRVKLAADLGDVDWLPLASAPAHPADPARLASVAAAIEETGVTPERIVVPSKRAILSGPQGTSQRTFDIKRNGALNLAELQRAELPLEGSAVSTARNGQYVHSELVLDEAFWRVAGLYLAEGHTSIEPGKTGLRYRVTWSFHPKREEHLVDEVAAYWLRHGITPRIYSLATTRQVSISSRILGCWWLQVLGMGRTSYEQRLPDLIWERPEADKLALLSGLWEGDGSWSRVCGGSSVVLELGTVSDELADGVLRLLGDLGIVASWRVARTTKSTKDTHWITISGAAHVEQAIELVPRAERAEVLASMARQRKRIAPCGHRCDKYSGPWVRVTSASRQRYSGHVYSLEVPGTHSFVATGGLVTHNCFPKDVQALKQLAGNSGYHFQLLTAVIEVNELQKRRTIGKLQKHLGSLVGKQIALLGVAFKPNTDDIREATSLVLSGRLAGEGAHVRVYDPVAAAKADGMLAGAQVADSALEAVDGADAVVLVTEWPEFRELDWAGEVKSRLRTPIVIDGRNFLDREELIDAGFTYEGIGR